jgi:hypothetical protein
MADPATTMGISLTIVAAAGGALLFGYNIQKDTRAFRTESDPRLRQTCSLIRAKFIDRTVEKALDIVDEENKAGAKTSLRERVEVRFAEQAFREHILTQTDGLEDAKRAETLRNDVIRRRRLVGTTLLPAVAAVVFALAVLFAFFPLYPNGGEALPFFVVIGYGASLAAVALILFLAAWQYIAANRGESEFDRIVDKTTRFLD